MLDRTYKHWGPPSRQGSTEQLDWEPQPGLASYPEENLKTNYRLEKTIETIKAETADRSGCCQLLQRVSRSWRQITIFVQTHGSAHSSLEVLRQQLGDSGQDVCDAVQSILKVGRYICGNILETWNFYDHWFLWRDQTSDHDRLLSIYLFIHYWGCSLQ